MRLGLSSYLHASEHAGNLGHSLITEERLEPTAYAFLSSHLLNPNMVMRLSRDLRQMGDAKHLPALPDGTQLLPNYLCDSASNARIDLVEDHGGNPRSLSGNDLQGEADAGELAPRRDLGKREGWLAAIGAHQQLDLIQAARAQTGRVSPLYRDGDLALWHA